MPGLDRYYLVEDVRAGPCFSVGLVRWARDVPGGSAAGTLLQGCDWLRSRDEGCMVMKPHWPISTAGDALSSKPYASGRPCPLSVLAQIGNLFCVLHCLASMSMPAHLPCKKGRRWVASASAYLKCSQLSDGDAC